MSEKNDVPMIPKHEAESMMLHLEMANRNMMIVAIVFALALYEYMHERNIEKAMRVKVKQAMYRE